MTAERILPTPDELDRMPFHEIVCELTFAIEHVVSRALRRAATRRAEGRSMSASDLRDLNDLALSIQALRTDAIEMLDPGTTINALRAAIANLETDQDTQENQWQS